MLDQRLPGFGHPLRKLWAWGSKKCATAATGSFPSILFALTNSNIGRISFGGAMHKVLKRIQEPQPANYDSQVLCITVANSDPRLFPAQPPSRPIPRHAPVDLVGWHNGDKLMFLGTPEQALVPALILSVVLVVPLAAMSYRWIEKPAMDAARRGLSGITEFSPGRAWLRTRYRPAAST